MRYLSALLFLSLLLASPVSANSGAQALIKKVGEDAGVKTQTIVARKEIKLDDPFLIQLYGSWKAQREASDELHNWMELIFSKNYSQAFQQTPKKQTKLTKAARLYLAYRLGLNQLFLNEWLNLASSGDFINTELSMALDQIVSKAGSKWFYDNGVALSEAQTKKLASIVQNSTNIHQLVLAWSSRKKGAKASKYLGILPANDPLTIELAKTVVIHHAKNGDLAKAASVLKKVYEPGIEKSQDIKEISDYYMMLARLLYQANAFEASKHYYELIPEESNNYLASRVERSWILLQQGDLSSLRGEMESFDFELFKDKFYPEVYWARSIGHLKLCQFESAQKTFLSFIENNRDWARKIEENLEGSPEIFDKKNPYARLLNKGAAQTQREIDMLRKLKKDSSVLAGIKESYATLQNKEAQRVWRNKKKILENTIHKMRFVKVEFISLMRRLKDKLYQHKSDDSVRTSLAGTLKEDQITFPYDGMIWGDELFQLKGELSDLCLKESKI